MNGALYAVEKTCVICSQPVEVLKVRSRLVMDAQDTDFCSHFRDFNPYYYTVWSCPHCGYAAPENSFCELNEKAVKKIAEFLKGRQVRVNYSGERTVEQAVDTYKLAIFYSEFAEFAASKTAELYLKLAWLYRETGQGEDEIHALAKARDTYEKAMAKEAPPYGGLSDTAACYLVGELSRRIGDIETALLWLGKVVGSPQSKLEPRVLNMARDAWHEARSARDVAAGSVVAAEENPSAG